MADNTNAKGIAPVTDVAADTNDTHAPVAPTEQPSWDANNTPIARPAGWMYKGFKMGKTELWYASPKVQLLMVAMVCFLWYGALPHKP